jgi:urea-proton symporter
MFLTNAIVISMLILGGAAVITALTGMDIYLASFLMPFGIIVYTSIGGLKATFISAYIHVAFIYVILCIFVFQVYRYSKDLGSAVEVWRRLTAVVAQSKDECKAFGYDPLIQTCGRVPQNTGGSYLTMSSAGGLMFGIINLIGNFGTVFVDQSYWHAAIAATPTSTHKGYMLGGLCWFAIPFTMATTFGLANVALQLPTTHAEANAGLVPAATAVAIMGPAGGVLVLIILFMAVTAAGSAELIAVASLCTYDIYRTYINPEATGKQIVFVSRITIVVVGAVMGALSCLLYAFGIGLGWVYLFMGIMIGSAVYPIWCCLTWKKATGTAAVTAAFVGQAMGLISWFVSSKMLYGSISVDNLGMSEVMLTGNVFSLIGSAIIMLAMSYYRPDDYNFDEMNTNITLVEKDDTSGLEVELYDTETLDKCLNWIYKYGFFFSFIIFVMWPCLTLPVGAFPVEYFCFWVAIAIVWGLVASAIVIGLPLWESRASFFLVCKGVTDDLFRGGFVPPPILPVKAHELEGTVGCDSTKLSDT